MRILSVVWGPFPDIRLQKTGRHLGEAGHVVDILCLQASDKNWAWGSVIEADLPGSIPLRAFHRAAYMLRRDPTVFPWRFRYAFVRALEAARYDLVIWNDLPGLLDAKETLAQHGTRLIFDMHENYADNMWSTERDLGISSWHYSMNDWLRYEAKAVKAADHILVNIEEMGQRVVGMHGVDPRRMTAVRNAEPAEVWRDLPRDPDLAKRFEGKFVLSFISSCSRHRGMDVIIKAMPAVLQRRPDIAVVVVGDGNGLLEWKALARQCGVEGNVHFEGRLPFARAIKYFSISDAGLIPHHKYAQTDNGIPHKYAQNIMAGLPIVVSSCHALERLTRELDCGVVFAAGDPQSAAEAMITLTDDGTRTRLGSNGQRAALSGVMSWDRMKSDLLRACEAALQAGA